MKRRTFLKKLFSSTLGLLGLGGGTYYYAREIEPGLLAVRKDLIKSPKIAETFHNFKIVQFSDTHIGFNYSLEQLSDLVTTINEQNPDMVVFTGDLVDKPNNYSWGKQLVHILSSIIAPYGKYWVYGNHDHGGYGTDIVKKTMQDSGFRLLQNSHSTIKKGNDSFNLIGLDDVLLGKPDIETALAGIDEKLFSLLLVHEPDFADQSKTYPIDVQLSGHSHGGQVQIPFFGYIYTPEYAQIYVEGNYQIGERPLSLFVSRGIGTTRLPYRFLCKPEISVFTLKNTTS
ncbi:metallophosphoesterase [Aquibacillus salsiterrae]|uniref:Metallophosphoesterase n=1 Tax=Aquibacillus salsiterrae TaxID=2950439 RepID=A0A9X4AEB0_9BACI|nr:metallophosphoesterase [Aquibacillus salsiterrae]MDC3416546.1 metallophosphoesterase [Aquibacillus salsiterrae]